MFPGKRTRKNVQPGPLPTLATTSQWPEACFSGFVLASQGRKLSQSLPLLPSNAKNRIKPTRSPFQVLNSYSSMCARLLLPRQTPTYSVMYPPAHTPSLNASHGSVLWGTVSSAPRVALCHLPCEAASAPLSTLLSTVNASPLSSHDTDHRTSKTNQSFQIKNRDQ